MKKLFKISGVLLAVMLGLLISTNQAGAQNRPHQHPPMLPDSTKIVKMVEELSKELSLSESQKAEITELHFAHFAEAKAKMEKDKAGHEKNRESMDALRKEFEAQVSGLLTDEQKTRFENLMKNRGPHHQKGNRKPQH